MDYKEITVEDIVKFVDGNKSLFPKGLKTPVLTGDFECNATHGKHEIQIVIVKKNDVVKETSICLGYEMHESIYPW